MSMPEASISHWSSASAFLGCYADRGSVHQRDTKEEYAETTLGGIMRFSLLPLAFAALLVPAAAKADTLFTVTGSGGGFSASATLHAEKNSDPTLPAGSYTITGIDYPGLTILAPGTALPPINGAPGSNELYVNDNLLFFNDPFGRQLDSAGFSFQEIMNGASFTFNIFNSGFNPDGSAAYEASGVDSDGDFIDVPISNFAVTAVTPEPSSLLLLGTGLTGAAVSFLRKKRTA